MDGTEVWIHGWDVCRGWTKACMGWPQLRCCQVNALFFPYASPSAKAEGSADLLLLYIRIYLIVYIYVNMCILQDNKESDL